MTKRLRRRRRSLRTIGAELVQGAGAYGLALALLLLTFLCISVGPGNRLVEAAGTVLAILALVVTLRAADTLRPPVVLSIVVVAAVVLVGRQLTPPDDRLMGSVSQVVLAVLAVLGPLAIVADLIDERTVTTRAVAAALCLYLLVGVTFMYLFGAMQYLGGAPFFAGRPNGTSADFLYFSLATLTTTGFGDFAAADPVGRTVSVLEAVLGQLWLVTVVGGLVGAAAVSVLPPSSPAPAPAAPAEPGAEAARLD